MSNNMRVMRIVLAVDQIRRMDQLVLGGVGGFASRNEFIAEAIESQILDLSFPAVGPEPSDLANPVSELTCEPATVVELEIVASDWGYEMPPEIGRASAPLFGLHNRDYPSLWALWRLSQLTQDRPSKLSTSLQTVTREAWDAGRQLQLLSTDAGEVITSLFPTNHDKRDAAEDAFREFAIGSAVVSGVLRTSGPLFEWEACNAELDGTDVVVGVTRIGWELLTQMDGLRPIRPHAPEHARAFAAHLKSHAPADWKCFELVLESCDDGNATRADVVDAFTTAMGLTSESVASTYAAGYVARCREWGLLEPKQLKGKYAITDIGRDIREEDSNGNR